MNNKDKFISVEVPCYNEVDNVRPMAETLIKIMDKEGYPYHVFFIDNCSTDGTQDVLRELEKEYPQVKAIMNMRNYGVMDGRSFENADRYYADADVHISIACDFQEPPELIPQFIREWENGNKIVCGQKTGSKEGRIKYGLRCLYYKIIQGFSMTEQYRNMSGILLFDKDVHDAMAGKDRDIEFRFAVADMGYDVKLIQYEQQKRKSGKSSYNIWRYLSFAINSMVNISTQPLRIITIMGFCMSFISFMGGMIYLILKLIFWYNFDAGIAPILIGMLFIGSIQMFTMGVIGEYIGVLIRKNTHMPKVVLSEKLNIDEGKVTDNK